MLRGTLRGVLIVSLTLLSFLAPVDSWAKGKQEAWIVEASAYNPSWGIFQKHEMSDHKQIDIEDHHNYVSHSISFITANPREENNDRWSCTDGLIRGEDGRVQAVWIEVKAKNKGLLDHAVWVRARLTVIVEEQVPGEE